MTLKETIKLLKKAYPILKFESKYEGLNTTKPYVVQNLKTLRKAIDELSEIDFLSPQITKLTKGALYRTFNETESYTSADNNEIDETVNELRLGIKLLIQYYENQKEPEITENIILVRLPNIENFDDLAKASNDFKKVIEIPINDSNSEGTVNILSAEKGSIWLTVSLTTLAAVNLIGAICWAAAVIRKKMAEASIFEAHAKTLNLKNDAIETLVNAQKEQINNLLTAEAEAIISKNYDLNDPEVLARLKLSLNTMADLMDRGAKIIPAPENDKVTNLFPNDNNIGLITSAIKQIQEGNAN